MTEEETRKKFCPELYTASPNEFSAMDDYNCIASDCMMWRWHIIKKGIVNYEYSAKSGYCGLAGEYEKYR